MRTTVSVGFVRHPELKMALEELRDRMADTGHIESSWGCVTKGDGRTYMTLRFWADGEPVTEVPAGYVYTVTSRPERRTS